jgi:hypothetical protein
MVVRHGPGVFELLIILFAVFMVLAFTVIKVFSFCRIFSKVGYSWAFGLLTVLPMAEVIIPLVLALMEWPVSREVRELKQGKKDEG